MPTGLAPEIVHFTPHGTGQQEKDSIGGPDFMVKPQVSTGLHCPAAGWLLLQACTGLFSGAAPKCHYPFQRRLSVSAQHTCCRKVCLNDSCTWAAFCKPVPVLLLRDWAWASCVQTAIFTLKTCLINPPNSECVVHFMSHLLS